MRQRRRSVIVAAMALLAAPARAQGSGYAAAIATIAHAERRITLKGSMGQLTVRVAAGVAIDGFKPGDKVLVTFGQEATEPVITRMELLGT
jgi:non-ribosomal peptide synthetase component E (peptide arylation enzyme)